MMKLIKLTTALLLCILLIFASFPLTNLSCIAMDVNGNSDDVFPSKNVDINSFNGTCGVDTYWEFKAETRSLYIFGTGSMENYTLDNPAPWNNFRRNIAIVEIENDVKSIGDYAFIDCSKLTSISLCSTLLAIGKNAFKDCISLTNISIPEGIQTLSEGMFYNCSAITTVNIPNSVTAIDDSVFYGCIMLIDITIPDEVEHIGRAAFSNCSSVTEITLPDKVKTIEDNLFYTCTNLKKVTVLSMITGIGDNAFYGCSALVSIVIPDSVINIGEYAFYSCGKITGVTIPGGVASIGNYAFGNCIALSSISVADSVTEIGESAFFNTKWYNTQTSGRLIYIGKVAYKFKGTMSIGSEIVLQPDTKSITEKAFYGYTNLVRISIPDTLVAIGGLAFYGCTGLEEFLVSDDNQIYSSYEGLLYNKDKTTLVRCPGGKSGTVSVLSGVISISSEAFYKCVAVVNISIPQSVKNIEDGAFRDCIGLMNFFVETGNLNFLSENGVLYNKEKSVLLCCPAGTSGDFTVSADVVDIGNYAFYNCYNLTNIFLYDGVKTIGDSAFFFCTSLTQVALPNSINSLGTKAFYNCTGLTGVTLSDNIEIIGKYTFYNCYKLTSITLPSQLKSIGYVAFCDSGLTNIIIPDYVVEIGIKAFYSCNALASVTMGNKVEIVDEYAFAECINITSITIPESMKRVGKYAFSGCDNLGTVTFNAIKCDLFGEYLKSAFTDCVLFNTLNIGSNVESIPNHAFQNCSKITSVNIPNSVTEIGDYAFYNCLSLAAVSLGNGVQKIGDNAFAFSILSGITLPSSLRYIGNEAFFQCSRISADAVDLLNVVLVGDKAFAFCTGIHQINLGGGIIYFGVEAFRGCETLAGVLIPNGITYISNWAFADCFGLASVTIADSVTSIGGSAFYRCNSLNNIRIPAGVTSIGNYAFQYCINLVEIVVDENNNNYASFDGMLLNKTKITLICYPAGKLSATYPNELRIIGDLAFAGNDKITDIIIPDQITSIENYTFESCINLNKLTIPNSVISIGEQISFGKTIFGIKYSQAYYYALMKGISFSELCPISTNGTAGIIDSTNHQIYGLDLGIDTLLGYITVVDGCSLNYINSPNGFGSGTVVNIINDSEIVDSYTLIFFGDTSGDGMVDSLDAGKMVDYENYVISWDPAIDSAFIKAGDLNGDGSIDSIDASIAVDVENYLLTIDQSVGLSY